METRRSKYGWMMLGGLLCLFALVFACKVRDGNRAYGQAPPPPPPGDKADKADAPPTSPAPPPPSGEVKAPVPDAPPAPPPAPGAAGPADAPPPPPAAGSEAKPILIPGGTAPPPPPAKADVPPPPADAAAPPPPAKADVPPPPSRDDAPAKVEAAPPKADVPGEPPLAPDHGPVVDYKVRTAGQTFKSLARQTLSNSERWGEIHKLNPTFKADATIPAGTVVRLPGDACITDDGEAVRALPNLRSRPAPKAKAKAALPLTGTYHVTLDDKLGMTLPKAVLDQLANCDTVLVSPGSDRCLWLTNQAHLDRMAAKLDRSAARETDVRNFKRLYYAQTVKVPVKDGHVSVTEKLSRFAGLGQELVLVGIDDHFEVWDAARWRRYTQAKKATLED
jgi:division/cell wall cluster transcriptional repressor MraZ